LPPAVEYIDGRFGIIFQVFDSPGIVYTIAVRGKRVCNGNQRQGRHDCQYARAIGKCIISLKRVGYTFLIVEYDTVSSNPWVPYPVNYQNLLQLFTGLGYSTITKLAEVPSRFGGSMYSALIRL
jgi:hypothetical protein